MREKEKNIFGSAVNLKFELVGFVNMLLDRLYKPKRRSWRVQLDQIPAKLPDKAVARLSADDGVHRHFLCFRRSAALPISNSLQNSSVTGMSSPLGSPSSSNASSRASASAFW